MVKEGDLDLLTPETSAHVAGQSDVDLLPRISDISGMTAALAWLYLGGDSFAAAHIEDAAGAYFNNLNVWFALSWTPGTYIGQGKGYAELVKAAMVVYMSINTRRWLFRAPSKAARDAAPPGPTDANGDSLAAFPIDPNSLDDVEEVSAFAACLDKKYEGGVDLVLEMRGCFPHPDDAHLLGFEVVDQPPNHIIKSTLMHVVRAR